MRITRDEEAVRQLIYGFDDAPPLAYYSTGIGRERVDPYEVLITEFLDDWQEVFPKVFYVRGLAFLKKYIFIEERSSLGIYNKINYSLTCDAYSLVKDNINYYSFSEIAINLASNLLVYLFK
jgi:hypothetical protein